MKMDSFNVTFPNELGASLDSPDANAYGWVLHDYRQKSLVRNQGCGNLIYWTGIVGITMPFQVTEGIKPYPQK